MLLFIFLFGLIIGSFLNVLVYRRHTGESIVNGRSKCPHCGHVLTWTDLVPVFSFIFLRGQCHYCHKKISWQYPLVELVTGLLFVVAYIIESKLPIANLQFTIDTNLILILLRDFVAISALVAIFVYDYKWMIIPDSIALPALALVFAINWLTGTTLTNLLIGALVGFGFFAVQFYVSKGVWVGGGDMRLGALMGALLGWPLIIVALFFAYIFGAIISVFLLIKKQATGKTAVPFGVFLVPSTILTLFWGQQILIWYLGF